MKYLLKEVTGLQLCIYILNYYYCYYCAGDWSQYPADKYQLFYWLTNLPKCWLPFPEKENILKNIHLGIALELLYLAISSYPVEQREPSAALLTPEAWCSQETAGRLECWTCPSVVRTWEHTATCTLRRLPGHILWGLNLSTKGAHDLKRCLKKNLLFFVRSHCVVLASL